MNSFSMGRVLALVGGLIVAADLLGAPMLDAAEDLTPDFLGTPAPTSFKGQPALPVTGAPAVGASVGAASGPTGPVSAPGGSGIVTQIPRVGPAGSISLDTSPNILSLIQRALGQGMKAEDIVRQIAATDQRGQGPEGQPSDQVSGGELAPESTVPSFALPFGSPAEQISGGEIGFGQMAPGSPFAEGDVPGGAAGLIGPAFQGAQGIFNLIQALRAGSPGGAGVAGLNLAEAAAAAGEAGAFGADISAALAPFEGPVGVAALPLAIASGMIGNATNQQAERVKNIASEVNRGLRNVPVGLNQQAAGAETFPTEDMTTEQLQQIVGSGMQGVSAAAQLADPFNKSGATKTASGPFGDKSIKFPDYTSAIQRERDLLPLDYVNAIRAADILAKRGVPLDPGYFGATGEGPFGSTPIARLFGGLANFAGNLPGSAVLGSESYTGKPATGEGALAETDQPVWTGVASVYSPDIVAALQALKPGGYEAGFRDLFRRLNPDTFADSPLGQLWTALESPPAGQETAPVDNATIQAALAPSPVASPSILGQPQSVGTGGAESLGGGGADLAREALGA